MMATMHGADDISRHIWETKYRSLDPPDRSVDDTWRRIARHLARAEPADRPGWEQRFYEILRDFKFLPGGRIHAGAGARAQVTLFNCFVMGAIEDSIPGIFRALQDSAVTMQQGGGIGCDFSTLRPRGTRAQTTGTIASGPVSFMQVWDAMCDTILCTGARRGAMMATLRCDHPDIEEFVSAKQMPGRLRRFNLSVQVTDAFVQAVRADAAWPLVFPAASLGGEGETVMRAWTGSSAPVACRVVRDVRARPLWEKILRASYDYAEPGVLFVDRINRLNNLGYREHISSTNPCGEVPLPPHGACDLGSINLARFVRAPFTEDADLDLGAVAATAGVAVRMLDNVIDASRFPLPQQAEMARGARRIGLGITGLADALLMLGHVYGDAPSLALAAEVMAAICHEAYRTSVALAREKGRFPWFDAVRYPAGAFIRTLPDYIRRAIETHGIRNSHLLAIAPTGTVSLLAGNVSSGLEPIFAGCHRRAVLGEDGRPQEFVLTDYALQLWRGAAGGRRTDVPPGFVTAGEVPPRSHLAMQAALQPFVDNAISKTVTVPESCPFADFAEIYDQAYDLGLKGCTTFRSNPVTGAVLSEQDDGVGAPHCCAIEREAD
jgi:ribonucleoside-diphosphate reductase alpha chain